MSLPSKEAIYAIKNTLIVPIPENIETREAGLIRRTVLPWINRKKIDRLVMDFTAVQVLDSLTYESLKKTSDMVKLMGIPTVFTGFQPGVASVLVELEENIDSLVTLSTLEEALSLAGRSHE
ncbi:MAG: STAS domain-containing protein [Spirochaetales bacterium]|nr:STAS domain-containing protein [Spirochaetales bacterium]